YIKAEQRCEGATGKALGREVGAISYCMMKCMKPQRYAPVTDYSSCLALSPTSESGGPPRLIAFARMLTWPRSAERRGSRAPAAVPPLLRSILGELSATVDWIEVTELRDALVGAPADRSQLRQLPSRTSPAADGAALQPRAHASAAARAWRARPG